MEASKKSSPHSRKSNHMNISANKPNQHTLAQLIASGWKSRSVKSELRSNFEQALKVAASSGERGASSLFPGILGYDDTVLPELATAIIAGHDILFLGEKGQGKSRLMRMLPNFLDEWLPYLDIPGCAVHEDPQQPITRAGREMLANSTPEKLQFMVAPQREICRKTCAWNKVCRFDR